ncbi:hypothetical protein BK133_05175 [Paenibacillus sp. FSL H8-0548]|uniref:hypothetical protein n=1 Tax=Paenibacillus sp. FSL H8-0548 TaxID=1920422 RepID=UPI00096E858E|nr:hypothetical protein [Paenibacillus sp. FSL H8-0548]OMF37449.1 hypothetical protein BK133_05175 [Paenibacillus sp. FSL H8-0548]
MLAMADFEQVDLFPRATVTDIRDAKKHLNHFQKYESMAAELKRRGLDTLTVQQLNLYNLLISRLANLRSAVNLIIDTEVREIIEYRYIEGNKHAVTIEHFSGPMDDRTIERKLCKGIESVAESYKIMTVK